MAEGRAAAILLAAGRGRRLGAGIAKGLVEVGGRSLVSWCVRAVEASPDVAGFVVTAPERALDAVRAEAASPKLLAVVPGGVRRQDSVAAALAGLGPEYDRVVCHDVARPFATPELFGAVLAALERADGAVPVLPAVDTLKRVRDGAVAETLAREEVYAAQTPQAFRRAPLEDAHRLAASDTRDATDDASLLERAGYRVAIVLGDPDNFKLTVPTDLRRAESLVSARG